MTLAFTFYFYINARKLLKVYLLEILCFYFTSRLTYNIRQIYLNMITIKTLVIKDYNNTFLNNNNNKIQLKSDILEKKNVEFFSIFINEEVNSGYYH